jgi:hypothetical protein
MAEDAKKEIKDEVEQPAAAPLVAYERPEDVTLDTKHKADERVAADVDGKPVMRKATFAELGLNTADEDMSKFVAPVAPSNAPQPKSFVGGIRTDYEPSAEEKKKLAEQKKASKDK